MESKRTKLRRAAKAVRRIARGKCVVYHGDGKREAVTLEMVRRAWKQERRKGRK